MMDTKNLRQFNGILVVDKPSGITSHDVVDIVRRRLNMKQVGHAGTLDPLATGVLVILLGQATKLFNKFSIFDKAYTATMTLGLKTDTADIRGHVIAEKPYDFVTESRVKEVFKGFLGEINQVPPMVSALKHKGKRLYQLARQGIEVEREARRVKVYSIELLEFALPKVKFSLDCSKGTYVRKIAEDAGELLGCGGCISQIHRTKVGPFSIEQAVKLENFSESDIKKADFR
ncbi:MAG: tRNA pseudouridine(55) synthase TruB [Candidatus Omnitrophica bacterium]|nr:tRNA pseudouridine(55) synthase TruB [Candidatus Omnitrophota bacterium]